MRRAIVLGSNGPKNSSPLRFAKSDADRVAECLSNPICGFSVETPKLGSDAWEVRRLISTISELCTNQDTLICYFSGHGVLEQGALFLLWDTTDTERLLGTSIPVSDLLQSVAHCKAENKLLILDCCHAGAAVNVAGFKDASDMPIEETEIKPSNFLILMASSRLEKARELDSLEGSFLTANLCRALSTSVDEADNDGDHSISIGDLTWWLQRCAAKHNFQEPSLQVPIPYLFGKQKGEIHLTIGMDDLGIFEIDWIDGSRLVVLPFATNSRLLAVAKNPVTNQQYKNFVEATGGSPPTGKHFDKSADKYWKPGFYPWKANSFADPQKPVVCVSLSDAFAYCNWVNSLPKSHFSIMRLPRPIEWHFACYGVISDYSRRYKGLHHAIQKTNAPAIVDLNERRANLWGISDMIGNVWEWCYEEGYYADDFVSLRVRRRVMDTIRVELKGGGFFDDLSKINLQLSSKELEDGVKTKHSDLGFRVVVELPITVLPDNLRTVYERISQSTFIQRLNGSGIDETL